MSSRQPAAVRSFGRPNMMVRFVRNRAAARAAQRELESRGGATVPPMAYRVRWAAYDKQNGARHITARQARQLRRMFRRNGF